VLIISADKDLMQLVGPGVACTIRRPASATGPSGASAIGELEVIDYFGVPPDEVVDVQALAGDSTDNVPGAPGIGVKTAAQLITEYGDLDTLLARAGEIKQPKRRETLTDPEVIEKVRISKKLVRWCEDVPVLTPLDDLAAVQPDGKPLIAFLKALEFTTITKPRRRALRVDPGEIEPDPDCRPAAGAGATASASGAAAMRRPSRRLPGRRRQSRAGATTARGAPPRPHRRRRPARRRRSTARLRDGHHASTTSTPGSRRCARTGPASPSTPRPVRSIR
jgi:DNA polymerase-1